MKMAMASKKLMAVAAATALTLGSMAPAADVSAKTSITDWATDFFHYEDDGENQSATAADASYSSYSTDDSYEASFEANAVNVSTNTAPSATVAPTAKPAATTTPAKADNTSCGGSSGSKETTIEAEDEDVELCRPQIKGVKYFKASKVKLSFKKIDAQADGYEVRYSRFSSMVMSKKVTRQGDGSCTVSNLKRSKTYYAQVRVFTVVDGKKVYSEWSVKQKILVRK